MQSVICASDAYDVVGEAHGFAPWGGHLVDPSSSVHLLGPAPERGRRLGVDLGLIGQVYDLPWSP